MFIVPLASAIAASAQSPPIHPKSQAWHPGVGDPWVTVLKSYLLLKYIPLCGIVLVGAWFAAMTAAGPGAGPSAFAGEDIDLEKEQ